MRSPFIANAEIEALAETYLNGKLSDVRDALRRLPPLVAAAVASELITDLGSEGFGFRAQLLRWAENDQPPRRRQKGC